MLLSCLGLARVAVSDTISAPPTAATASLVAPNPRIGVIDFDGYATARAEFKKAYALADGGLPDSLTRDSAALLTYPLYPYLQAARIRRGWQGLPADPVAAAAADTEALTFLATHGSEPVGRDLRRAWLASFADRRQWHSFLTVYTPEVRDDPVMRCNLLAAKIDQVALAAAPAAATSGVASEANSEATSAAKLANEVAEFWVATTAEPPPACQPVFAWLQSTGRIDATLTERRARGALLQGHATLARQLAGTLPGTLAAPILQWAGLIEEPRPALDSLIAAPGTSVETAAVLDGWTRMVRKDQDAALDRFQSLIQARKLDAHTAGLLAKELALSLAWARRSEALDYFARVDEADFDERAFEWRARAALWKGDRRAAAKAIVAMPDTLRSQVRWRYWSARLAQQAREADAEVRTPTIGVNRDRGDSGDVRDARAETLYRALSTEDNFYGALAAARLHLPYAPHPKTLDKNSAAMTVLAGQPALVRAHQLLLAGLMPQATAEWQYGYETVPTDNRPAAVHLAMQWGWYDRGIATAAQLKVFDDYGLLYPRPYDTDVRAAATATGLPPELLYGIVRQESLYRPDARSSVGALGVMQLMPATARQTAQRLKQPAPRAYQLFDPQINIPLGAANLRYMLDRANGQRPVAIAAYNAGINAALRWLPGDALDADVWIENIPYNETRAYVQKVLWHSLVFAWLSSGEAQNTTSWLAPIKATQ